MTSYKKCLKRIIPCVILGLALVLMIVFNLSNKKPSGPVIIPDDNTPLSDKIQAKASFYLFNPGNFTPDFTNVTPDLADYIGEGTVYFSGDIYNNPAEVAPMIASEPDYSSILPSNKAVAWSSIYLYGESKEICVIGLSADKSEVAPVVEEPDIPVVDPSSVLYYGAKGDGETDDTAAITEALKNTPDGKVYIPRGTYVISSTVRIPSNIHIVGDGDASIILAAPGTSRGTSLLMLYGSNNVELKNICVSGNSAVNYENMDDQGGIHLLDIWNSNDVSVDNCTFRDNINIAIRDVASNNVTISNCYFKEVDCGFITMGSSDNIHDITIINNRFDGHHKSEPISLYADAPHTNVLIENNIILNKRYGGGILVAGRKPCSNIMIRNNTLDATGSGMRIQNSSAVQVLHNSVANTQGGYGVKLINCNDITLDDNIITNIQQDGLYVSDCTNITIHELKTINCGQINENYFNIRFTGTRNDNITFSDSDVTYDNTSSKIGMCFTCETNITLSNINYKNATVWMTKTCTGTSLTLPASIKVRDQGVDNSVTRH